MEKADKQRGHPISIEPKYGVLPLEQQAIADELLKDMPMYKLERAEMNMPPMSDNKHPFHSEGGDIETVCPMNNIDKYTLRKLVRRATQGSWTMEHEISGITKTVIPNTLLTSARVMMLMIVRMTLKHELSQRHPL